MNLMTARRAAIFVIVLGALAAWIAAAATSGVRDVKPMARFAPPAIDTSGAALAAEIDRLHDHLRPTASPRLGRDLFQFAAARPPVAPSAALPAPPALVPGPAPVIPAAPALTLIGVAQDTVEGATVRTAIISTQGQLFLVKEGEDVTSAGSRYRVTRISVDSADLTAADETMLHLALK
jgi:hypothetical protein